MNQQNKTIGPNSDEAYQRTAYQIFIQACKDLMGMDHVPISVQKDAEEWLCSPMADLCAGYKGAGAKAVRIIKADPEGAKQRFLGALNAINAHPDA